jgi:arginase
MSRPLVVIGAPSSAGSYAPGQETAPAVLRALGLVDALRSVGRAVSDAGDGPLQVWRPDPEHPYAQNLPAVVESVTTLAGQVGSALDADADVLVLGGNCTAALGVFAAVGARDPRAGLLYIDRHFDLNTPQSTTDGALDWMGLAHGLDLPGVEPQLAAAFGRRPLLRAEQLRLIGVEPLLATPWENGQAERLGLRWTSSSEFARQPTTATNHALGDLPAGSLAVHVDVDVLDFTDAPLSESTDGRNTGPSLAALTEALDVGCHDPRFRVLSIGELNPGRAAAHPDILRRFVATLATALRPV